MENLAAMHDALDKLATQVADAKLPCMPGITRVAITVYRNSQTGTHVHADTSVKIRFSTSVPVSGRR